MAQLALIALGSNLGAPLANLRHAYTRLAAFGTIVAASGIYQTAAVGPAGQDDYLNAVLLLAPSALFAQPQRLLGGLFAIELECGRVRQQRWEARTLDLDLLAFGDRVIDEQQLTLPHPRMLERAFVLLPLAEIAADWRHPLTAERVDEALARLSHEGVRKTEFSWLAPAEVP